MAKALFFCGARLRTGVDRASAAGPGSRVSWNPTSSNRPCLPPSRPQGEITFRTSRQATRQMPINVGSGAGSQNRCPHVDAFLERNGEQTLIVIMNLVLSYTNPASKVCLWRQFLRIVELPRSHHPATS